MGRSKYGQLGTGKGARLLERRSSTVHIARAQSIT